MSVFCTINHKTNTFLQPWAIIHQLCSSGVRSLEPDFFKDIRRYRRLMLSGTLDILRTLTSSPLLQTISWGSLSWHDNYFRFYFLYLWCFNLLNNMTCGLLFVTKTKRNFLTLIINIISHSYYGYYHNLSSECTRRRSQPVQLQATRSSTRTVSYLIYTVSTCPLAHLCYPHKLVSALFVVQWIVHTNNWAVTDWLKLYS